MHYLQYVVAYVLAVPDKVLDFLSSPLSVQGMAIGVVAVAVWGIVMIRRSAPRA